MQIRIVGGNKPTQVTINFTHLGNSETFNVNEYEVYTYTLTIPQKEAVYNTMMGVSQKSIHVTSSAPVSVFAFYSSSLSSRDATNVLPVTALGTEYYQISYTATAFEDAYAVIATENNTNLWHNGFLEATLDAGEVYYRTSTNDMTGTHIKSDKPVAFFALHKGASIPGPLIHCQLFQQLAPIHTWDKTFFVPVTVVGTEFVRIVASQNNTTITKLEGGTIRTGVPGAQNTLTNLQAGEFVELKVFLDSAGCYIEADKPVGICSYMICTNYNGFFSFPSHVWIPGIKQTVSNAIIAPFITVSVTGIQHRALVFTPTATKNNTTVSIEGAPPQFLSGGGNWIDHPIAEMSFYNMPLTNDFASYIFSNPKGIVVLVYGVGADNGASSYYYLAYSAMRDLDAVFYANNIHFQDLKDTLICESTVKFRAEIEGLHPTVPDKLKWYIDGTEYLPALNQLSWNKTFTPGDYEIRMWVRYENNDTVSKTGTLKICNTEAAFYANNIHCVPWTDKLSVMPIYLIFGQK